MCGENLRGLSEKVLKHLKYAIYSNTTTDEKKAIFKNCYFHFMGIHTHCMPHKSTKPWKYANDKEAQQTLWQLIEDYSPT